MIDWPACAKLAHVPLPRAQAAASAAERQRVDEIFNHRQALEAQGREVENQLQHHMGEMARRLESADPGMRETFLKLQEQQQQLSHEVSKKQADLNYFTERLAEMEQVVARDELRAQARTVARRGRMLLPCARGWRGGGGRPRAPAVPCCPRRRTRCARTARGWSGSSSS
jgi:hypothetical protein